jgi:hypothetical protein
MTLFERNQEMKRLRRLIAQYDDTLTRVTSYTGTVLSPSGVELLRQERFSLQLKLESLAKMKIK